MRNIFKHRCTRRMRPAVEEIPRCVNSPLARVREVIKLGIYGP